ncbi:hypothetical protein AAG570_005196 [Ranatra chinensis]|uniref:Uncharacterized protein n=1 Tax=Ranatra chinensis TaxID=642074 RepID=A0ABD0XZQ6_9HEMI
MDVRYRAVGLSQKVRPLLLWVRRSIKVTADDGGNPKPFWNQQQETHLTRLLIFGCIGVRSVLSCSGFVVASRSPLTMTGFDISCAGFVVTSTSPLTMADVRNRFGSTKQQQETHLTHLLIFGCIGVGSYLSRSGFVVPTRTPLTMAGLDYSVYQLHMAGSNMWEMERRYSVAENDSRGLGLPPPSLGMVPSTSEDLHAWSIYRELTYDLKVLVLSVLTIRECHQWVGFSHQAIHIFSNSTLENLLMIYIDSIFFVRELYCDYPLKAEDGVQAPKHFLPGQEAGDDGNWYVQFAILL